jgi:pimeloyl-ACP methyl ester carboxylesterase
MLARLLLSLVVLLLLPAQATLADTLNTTTSAHTTVLFVGGYGSNLATVAESFAALRSAFAGHDSSTTFAQFSYTGWNAQACAPLSYQSADTAQDLATSERRLLDTIYALQNQCGAGRIVVVGHSLGGLVAFHALADSPMAQVSDIVTIDSPLGGVPPVQLQTCVDAGLCDDGPISGVLSGLFTQWDQTARDNAARVGKLAAAGIRVTAWGNQSDCLYAPAQCVPMAAYLLGVTDARDTQWLGIDHAMRRNYVPIRQTLASVLDSHAVVLSSASTDIVDALS